MTQLIASVYTKNNKISVVPIEDKEKTNKLISEGWQYSQALDLCRFIEYLHNDCEAYEIVDEIVELKLPLVRLGNENKSPK